MLPFSCPFDAPKGSKQRQLAAHEGRKQPESRGDWLLRDRDSIYSDAFKRTVSGMAITEVVSSPASPWQNPFVERLIGSVRRECLDHLIILNAAHPHRVLTAYFRYYHRSRTHLSLKKHAPDGRPPSDGSVAHIVALPEVGGLHYRYERRAA